MKTTIKIMTGLALMALLAGCVVTSVYPFYTAKDEVFEPALIGIWAEAGPTDPANEHWQFESLNGQAYWLTIIENGKTNRYETHRFRLKEHCFLDLRTTNHHEEHLPLHYLIKIAQDKSKLRLTLLNFEWLTTLLQKNPKALRHILVPDEPGNTNNQQLVLTADTRELQRFVLKHFNDTNAFGDTTEMNRLKH